MTKRRLGRSELFIEPLVLGTNVIGWTADEPTSFAVLDAFVAEGFSAIDTADVYSRWVPGNDSESERIIGRWLKARGNRDRVHVFTKVGSDMGQGHKDLSAKWIIEEVEHSLKRLQTDYIDLYQSHWPDEKTPEEETLGAYDTLIKAGKVRAIGASNYDEKLLGHAVDLAKTKGLPRYDTVQNEFNLYARQAFEGAVQQLCVDEQISGIHYYALAAGFLTGKYRKPEDTVGKARGNSVSRFMNDKGNKVLAALDQVASRTGASLTEIAIAWVVAQPGVAAPIASATSVAQLETLARGVRLVLSAEDLALLDASGR
jgi:aryl-alcohol dehydrogenase-like predicted oxidoreductase